MYIHAASTSYAVPVGVRAGTHLLPQLTEVTRTCARGQWTWVKHELCTRKRAPLLATGDQGPPRKHWKAQMDRQVEGQVVEEEPCQWKERLGKECLKAAVY
jgi:hypothetical protein